jgi:hypothetical protein
MPLEGDLKDISLTSVVQILCMERRKGGLFVRRRGEEGTVYFYDGEIVHATVGPLEGEEAIYQLLTWMDGTFRMNDQVTIPRKTIGMNWNHLMIEGMRRIDEQNRESASPTQYDIILTQAEVEQDGILENDLILLLSRLEQLMAQLGEKKIQKRPPAALELLAELVNQVIKYYEGIPKADANRGSLVKALMQAGDVYQQARILQAQYNRLSVQTAVNLYHSWAGDPNDRRYMFRQISRGMIHVLESYFSLFTIYFQSLAMRDQWKETYSVFIYDLTRAVDKVQF